MWNIVKIVFDVIGAVSLLIGFGGFKDDTKQWKEWVGSMPTVITPEIDRWLLIGFAAILVICANVLPWLLKKPKRRKAEVINQLNQFVRNGDDLLLKIDKTFPSTFPPKPNVKSSPIEREVAEWSLAVYNYLRDNVPARAEYYHNTFTHDFSHINYNIMSITSPQQKIRADLIAFIEVYKGRIIKIIEYVDSSSN